jgi:hypothetical protein
LNIPNYTLSGLGGVPTTRTLTINGTSFDLSADRSWTISAGVSGSGTTNYLSKWTSGTALGNSLIFDDGTNIGIGTTSPSGKLHVNGRIYGVTTSTYTDFNSGGLISYGAGSTTQYIQVGYDTTNSFGWIQSLNTGVAYNNLIINGAGGNVGIGTTSPGGKLAVTGDILCDTNINAAASYYIQVRKSRGSVASPSNIVAGDVVGGLLGLGYEGGSYRSGGAIQFNAESVSSGAVPMSIRFYSGGGVSAGTESLRINSNRTTLFFGDIFTYVNGGIFFQGNGTYGSGIYSRDSGLNLILQAGSAERVRINSSGDLLVNRTTAAYTSTGMTQVSVNGSSRGALSLTYTGSSSTGIMWYGSEQIDIYNTSTTGSIKVYANTNGVILGVNGTSWSSASDERLKTDILPIKNGLEKVASLRAITGRYKTDKEGTSRSFLIAQDVQSVLPEAVSINPSDGHLNLSYTEVIPLLVASIKELKVQVDELKANNR